MDAVGHQKYKDPMMFCRVRACRTLSSETIRDATVLSDVYFPVVHADSYRISGR